MISDTARLATVLTLKDGLSPGMNKSIGAVGKFDDKVGKAGKKVSALGGKLKTAGAVAGGVFAGGLLVGIKDGLDNLGQLESATTSVDAALKKMGKAGKITAGEIADWANRIEADVDAAFDDKEIVAATTTLIRFGKVTTANIKPAMVVMTDLAAKTGDVASASSLLAKALADPEKAAGRLTRAGLILTDAEQKQIKAFIKAGEKGKAQAVVLEAISKSTEGAAAAMNGPYVDAQKKLSDAVEDGTKALAVGFLPIITKVSTKLQKALADPKVIANIKRFGEGLAGAFDQAITFAEKIPWDAIGNGLKTAAEWAGKLFDAFRSLPPEAQATIVALAGLNKLSGGAVTGIVSELGKGLIKGVLGITAGVVNIKAASVVGGGGGVPGAGGAGAGATGGAAGALGAAGAAVGGAAAFAGIAEVQKQVGDMLAGLLSQGNANAQKSLGELFKLSSVMSNPVGNAILDLPEKLGQLPAKMQQTADFLAGKVDIWGNATTQAVKSTSAAEQANERGEGAKHRAAIARVEAKERESIVAFRAGERATQGVKGAVNSKMSAANAKLDAIRHKKTTVVTNVSFRSSVSVRNVNDSSTTSNNYGSKTTSKVL